MCSLAALAAPPLPSSTICLLAAWSGRAGRLTLAATRGDKARVEADLRGPRPGDPPPTAATSGTGGARELTEGAEFDAGKPAAEARVARAAE